MQAVEGQRGLAFVYASEVLADELFLAAWLVSPKVYLPRVEPEYGPVEVEDALAPRYLLRGGHLAVVEPV